LLTLYNDKARRIVMKMNRICAALLTATMMVMPLAGCQSAQSTSESSASSSAGSEASVQESVLASDASSSGAVTGTADPDKTLTVGFDAEFPPMGFMDEDGNYVGFDLDLAKEVADRLGYEFVAQPIAWDSKDTELESGNIDCIWNGFTISGREDQYTWTEPYMENRQVVVVNSDSKVTSLADLAGLTVAVQKDSSGLAALEENSQLTDTFGELVQEDSYLNALMELESGSVDAVVMDEIVARYEIQTSGKSMVVLDESIASEEYGVGFLLGNEALRDEVQATLEDMAADGTMAEISNKWFGEDITTIGK
jgi:polar amino acid transport system substrate-binding protein